MDREQVLFRLFGRYCPEGTILYTEGSPGEEAYLVQSGGVRLQPAAGPPREAGTGALIGEESFFERAARAARAEARGDTRLLQVGERTLDALARNGPDAAEGLVLRLAEAGEEARRALEAWAYGHALRKAEPLLREAAAGPIAVGEFLEAGGGNDVLRLLGELERRGALELAGEQVRLRDPAAFERAAAEIAAAGGEEVRG